MIAAALTVGDDDLDDVRQAFEDLRNDRWKALMHDVQGQLRNKKSVAKRESVLRQTLADEPYAQGAFIWAKGKGLVCSLKIPPDLAAKFPADYSWKEKGQTPRPRALRPWGDKPMPQGKRGLPQRFLSHDICCCHQSSYLVPRLPEPIPKKRIST